MARAMLLLCVVLSVVFYDIGYRRGSAHQRATDSEILTGIAAQIDDASVKRALVIAAYYLTDKHDGP